VWRERGGKSDVEGRGKREMYRRTVGGGSERAR